MTYSVIFSGAAVQQLDAIIDYVASAANPATAMRFGDAIVDHCLGLDTFPLRGMRRDDLRPGLRVMSYRKRVMIAFIVDEVATLVTVVGIFYGGQDIDAIFASERDDSPFT